MLEYIDTITMPYATNTRKKLELADDHPALALFDVFAAHHCDSVLDKLLYLQVVQGSSRKSRLQRTHEKYLL